MEIHIGEIIKKFADTIKIENMDIFCMEKLNMTKQNYYRIIRKSSMNTDLLLTFCAAFDHDFFQYYYNIEPLKSLGKNELKKLKEENQELNIIIQRKEDLVKDYERKITILKDENIHLKENVVKPTNTPGKRKR